MQEMRAAYDAGSYRRALRLCITVLETEPAHFEAAQAAGTCAYLLGDYQQAADHYAVAMDVDPDSASLYINIANLFHALGQFKEAVAMLERSITLQPDNHIAYNNLGNALKALGTDPQVVLAHYNQAMQIKPDYAPAHINAAQLFADLDDPSTALAIAHKGVAQCPSDTGLAALHAALVWNKAPREQVKASLEHLLDLDERSALARVRLMTLAKRYCDWETEEHHHAKLMNSFSHAFADDVKAATGTTLANHVGPFELLGTGLDLPRLKQATETFTRIRQRDLVYPQFEMPPIGDIIRVGYVSADMNAHAVGLLVRDLFRHHDRARFEVYAYYLRTEEHQDAISREIASGCDHFKCVGGRDYQAIARTINEDGIHILADLSGYTSSACPQVFDLRPAPVQCHLLGYPGTLGSLAIDYYLTTRTYTPPAIASHFTECMAYLPEVNIAARHFGYERPTPPRAELGLPEDAFVYFCFSGLYRIDRSTVDAWVRVLEGSENSVLWLMSDNAEAENNIRRYVEAQGVLASRLVFTPTERLTARGLHRNGDVLLDALTLTSGTAAIIALSEGIPVVTIAGATPESRTALAQLAGVDMQHLAGANVDEFVSTAVRMANDTSFYNAQRDRLTERLSNAPLFDRPRFVGYLEDAFETMMERHSHGLPPTDFTVSI